MKKIEKETIVQGHHHFLSHEEECLNTSGISLNKVEGKKEKKKIEERKAQ